MTKLSFDMTGIVVEVTKLKGKKLSKEVLEELITAFENKPMEEKIALIGSIRQASEGSLSFADVKIGQMVETSDGKFGMVTKINKKTILISSNRGMITGPPEAFKTTTKTANDLKEAHKVFFKHIGEEESLTREGQFVQVFIKNEWKNGITLNNLTRNSIKVYFYESGTSVNLNESHIKNPALVRKEA